MSIFGGGSRRFSSIKQRMSLTSVTSGDGDISPPALLRARHRKRGNTSHTDASLPEPQSLNGFHSKTMRSMVVPDEPDAMPDSEEINKRLETALDEMALPEANREAIRKQGDKKKWIIIQQQQKKKNNKKKSSAIMKNDAQSAYFWIKKMQQRDSKGLPVFTKEDGLKMQSVFRTSHKDFLADFIEGFAGVKALNRLTAYYSNLSKKRKSETTILSTLIDSYKLLMNNELGMKGVLLVPESVQIIAMCMDFLGDNHQLTEKVVTLLSVACWWDEEGRRSVMNAMKYLKTRYREISTFQTIVYLFEHINDVHFKASMATFITTVCNTPPTIEKRVSVRNHFYRLDVITIFDKVLSRKPEKILSSEEEQGWTTIETQFEVFVAMMRSDQKEIVHKLIRAADQDDSHFDLSNLQESWKILQKNALKADCQDELLNVVQALFLVPTVHKLAAPVYESIAKYVFQATSVENLLSNADEKPGILEAPEMNYAELSKLLKLKIEYDAKVEAFAEKNGIVRRQQKLIRILQKRLLDVKKGVISSDEATNLQEELIKHSLIPTQKSKSKNERRRNRRMKAGKQNAVVKKPSAATERAGHTSASSGMAADLALLAGLGITDTSNEIEIMKDRETKMKAEIDALQKQVQELKQNGGKIKSKGKDKNKSQSNGKLDSTGLVPAGIAPGTTLKEPPPIPLKGMPGSLENAPLEFTEAPEKKSGGKGLEALFAGRAAGMGKGPKPKSGGGGLEALFAGRAAAAKKPKKNLKAEKQRLALEKLGLPPKPVVKPGKKMTQVFWNVIDPTQLEHTIWPELSDQNILFNTNELEKLFGKKKVEKKKVEKKDQADEKIKLLDGRRRQNVAIALKKIKLPAEKIVEALTTVDRDILSPDKIQVFIETAPNTDELTLLNKYIQDGSKPEKLAGEEQYLLALKAIPGLEIRLQCIRTTYTFASDAKRILSVIVRMKKAIKEVNNSNELRKVLEIVLGIGNFMNGGTTRGAAWGFKLDILGNLINVKDSLNNGTLMHYLFVLFERNYPDLVNFSLPNSASAVNISFKDAVGEMNKLAKQVNVLKREGEKKPFSKKDKFVKSMRKFGIKAAKDIDNLQKALEKVRKDFEALAQKFAESGNNVEPKTFFPKLVSFEQNLKRAGNQLTEMREADARKKKAAQQKSQRNTVRKLKKLLEVSTTEEGTLNMDLIEVFKSQQNMKTNEVVDKFLAKYKRDQERKVKRDRLINKKKRKTKSSRRKQEI